jgi:hypothetical protein
MCKSTKQKNLEVCDRDKDKSDEFSKRMRHYVASSPEDRLGAKKPECANQLLFPLALLLHIIHGWPQEDDLKPESLSH